VVDVDCPGCEQRHDDRYLCDPGKQLLDAIAARAGSYVLEPIGFDEPVPAGLDQVADVVMAQFTVTAGVPSRRRRAERTKVSQDVVPYVSVPGTPPAVGVRGKGLL
jgi:hypothetical protein